LLNGVTLNGVVGISVDFGIEEVQLSGGGDVFATFVAIMNRRPSIMITTLDVDVALRTYGGIGAAISGTTRAAYRKLTQGGATSATEKTFTVAEGRISAQSGQLSHGSPATADIRISPTFDGTNDVIAISA
jgi:activator of HSP90 ATPase